MEREELEQELLAAMALVERLPASTEQTDAIIKMQSIWSRVRSEGEPDAIESEKRVATLGQRIVRTDFNPSKTGLVDQLKQRHARLIDLVHGMRQMNNGDVLTLDNVKQSIDALELSCMYAVKAATAGK